jgi:anaerobic selenocysteine-containing dehydrogenase
MEGDPLKFPLAMIPYDTVRLSGRHMANPPFMTKTLDDTVLKKNHGFIEINPATARQLRLAEGDMVKLSTPRGEAEVKVHLYEGVMPGVIALPRGLGHTAFTEEWGLSGRGANVNDLMGPVEDPASGRDMAWGIRAKLTKI